MDRARIGRGSIPNGARVVRVALASVSCARNDPQPYVYRAFSNPLAGQGHLLPASRCTAVSQGDRANAGKDRSAEGWLGKRSLELGLLGLGLETACPAGVSSVNLWSHIPSIYR